MQCFSLCISEDLESQIKMLSLEGSAHSFVPPSRVCIRLFFYSISMSHRYIGGFDAIKSHACSDQLALALRQPNYTFACSLVPVTGVHSYKKIVNSRDTPNDKL